MLPEERWHLRVRDILDAVARISEYLEGMSPEAFYEDQRTIDSIPWAPMRGMRNVIVHEYDAVDVEIVWETAQRELPALIGPLERILRGG